MKYAYLVYNSVTRELGLADSRDPCERRETIPDLKTIVDLINDRYNGRKMILLVSSTLPSEDLTYVRTHLKNPKLSIQSNKD